MRAELRGSYRLGPAILLARDVFGLVTASRTLGGSAALDVCAPEPVCRIIDVMPCLGETSEKL